MNKLSMQVGGSPVSAPEADSCACHHARSKNPGRPNDIAEQQTRSILPSVGSVMQAGAFGAALGGVTTGVMEISRVKQGEIGTDEAVKNVVKSSAQGAATMAVASVASQIVRSHPVFSIVALAAAGIGAYVILTGSDKDKATVHTAPKAKRPEKAVS